MPYEDLDLTLDPAALYQDAVTLIRDLAGDDDWQPSPIEDLLLMAGARMGVEVTVTAGKVPDMAIVPTIGQQVLRVPLLDATPATGSVTLHLVDAPDDVLPAASSIDIDGVGFHTNDDTTVTAGAATVTAAVTADLDGTGGNELAGSEVTLTSPSLIYVDTVTLDAPTSGGTDGETAEAYRDRLVEETPTLSPKAILISDFEALARKNPLVGRALAIDNYDPGPPIDAAAEGHVSVVVHDPAGQPLGAGTKSDIQTSLEADRVLAIVVHVLDPAYTPVVVAFTAIAYEGFDPATVQADGVAAIDAFTDNTTWGQDRTSTDPTDWIDENTLRRNDLLGVLYTVDGLRHVTDLTLARARPVTGVAATDVLTSAGHGFADDDPVAFTGLTGGAPLADATTYYVRDATTDTFTVAETAGGTAVDLTSDLTGGYVYAAGVSDVVVLDGPGSLPTPVSVTGSVS